MFWRIFTSLFRNNQFFQECLRNSYRVTLLCLPFHCFFGPFMVLYIIHSVFCHTSIQKIKILCLFFKNIPKSWLTDVTLGILRANKWNRAISDVWVKWNPRYHGYIAQRSILMASLLNVVITLSIHQVSSNSVGGHFQATLMLRENHS